MDNQKLLEIINGSTRILVTSHLRPDPDAITSVIFTTNIIKRNFKKEVLGVLQGEMADNFKKLKGLENTSQKMLYEEIVSFKPDLVVVVDVSNTSGITSNEEEIKKMEEIKTVVIDHHHVPENPIKAELVINNEASSTTEELFNLFIEKMNLPMYEGAANTVLLGIITDTGNFSFKGMIKNPKRTFETVAKLWEQGADMVFINSILNELTVENIKFMNEFTKNFTFKNSYVYSYISDEFYKKEVKDKWKGSRYKEIVNKGVNAYLSNIKDADFGFFVKPDTDMPGGNYNVSFRAKAGRVDTTVFSKLFNGGGHKDASAGSLAAASIEKAIEKVEEIIGENLEESRKKI